MSDSNAQEPTMEEILASIRRIISEDDVPAEGAPQASAEEAPEVEADADVDVGVEAAPALPEPLQVEEESEDDDILELTDPEPASSPAESIGDIEAFARPAQPAPAFEAPKPEPAARPRPAAMFETDTVDEEDDGLISGPTASHAATAFGQLSRSLAMPSEGRTLEDIVREMLRPMLKDWLDQNLPSIVETAVEAEVERISRRRF